MRNRIMTPCNSFSSLASVVHSELECKSLTMRGGIYYRLYSNRHHLNAASTPHHTYTHTDTNSLSVKRAVVCQRCVRQKFTHMLVSCRRRAQDSEPSSSWSDTTSRSCRLPDCRCWRLVIFQICHNWVLSASAELLVVTGWHVPLRRDVLFLILHMPG